MFRDDSQRRGGFERHGSCRYVIESRSQRIDVATEIQVLLADSLLGTHIVRSAHNGSGHGQRPAAAVVHAFRYAHVHQFRHTFPIDHYVGGFDVAVDDRKLVPGVLKRFGHLAYDSQSVFLPERSLLFEFLLERESVDVGHSQIVDVVVASGVEGSYDMRMLHFRRDANLFQKPVYEVGVEGVFS